MLPFDSGRCRGLSTVDYASGIIRRGLCRRWPPSMSCDIDAINWELTICQCLVVAYVHKCIVGGGGGGEGFHFNDIKWLM